MPVCPAAVALVKHFEGLYLKAYLCPAGVPTIGFGHTKGVKLGQSCTEAQAEQYLKDDLAEAAAVVDRLVTVPINQNQRGAIASFVFNLGASRLAGSTLLRLLNAEHSKEGVAEQFKRWTKSNGADLPGLVKRRAAEAGLFLTPC